jgi:hypothetical protein
LPSRSHGARAGVTADAPGGESAVLDREKPLSWSTEQREVESLRTSMDKFDRMDYDSHTKVRLNALYMCSNKSLWPRRLSVVCL